TTSIDCIALSHRVVEHVNGYFAGNADSILFGIMPTSLQLPDEPFTYQVAIRLIVVNGVTTFPDELLAFSSVIDLAQHSTFPCGPARPGGQGGARALQFVEDVRDDGPTVGIDI